MKSFALTSTSPTQIDLCYLTADPVQKNGLAAHLYYSNGNCIGSGRFKSRDLLGGIFLSDPNLGAALASGGKALATAASNYIVKAIGSGLSAITSVEIGSLSAVPCHWYNSGPRREMVVGQLVGIVFAQCDGLVAVEQVVKLGKDLQTVTAAGPYTMTTTHRAPTRLPVAAQILNML